MNNILFKLLFVITACCFLIACGGGGDDNKASKPVILDPAPSTLSGVFLDDVVINIGYRTATQQGVTNSLGEYNYLVGETVTFFIGALEFPPVEATGLVTPIDISGTNDALAPKVINMLRLLQTLDKDGVPNNGITITQDAIAAALPVDFDLTTEDFAVDANVLNTVINGGQDNAVTRLTPQIRAVEHFFTTLVNNNIQAGGLAYTPSELIVFGDSLSSTSSQTESIPSPNSGSNYVEPLAQLLGVTGTNFAFGGATSADMLDKVVNDYLLSGPIITSGSVYIISIGLNDGWWGPNLDQTILDNTISNISSMVQKLTDAGAKNIFVTDFENRGRTPGLYYASQTNNFDYNLASSQIGANSMNASAQLFNALQLINPDVNRLNLADLMVTIEADLQQYGFDANSVSTCYQITIPSIPCNLNSNYGENSVSPDVRKLLYNDHVHLSDSGYNIWANYIATEIFNSTASVDNIEGTWILSQKPSGSVIVNMELSVISMLPNGEYYYGEVRAEDNLGSLDDNFGYGKYAFTGRSLTLTSNIYFAANSYSRKPKIDFYNQPSPLSVTLDSSSTELTIKTGIGDFIYLKQPTSSGIQGAWLHDTDWYKPLFIFIDDGNFIAFQPIASNVSLYTGLGIEWGSYSYTSINNQLDLTHLVDTSGETLASDAGNLSPVNVSNNVLSISVNNRIQTFSRQY